MVNVLDPTTHKKNCTATSVQFDAKTGIAKIAETGVLPNTLVLKAGEKTLRKTRILLSRSIPTEQ